MFKNLFKSRKTRRREKDLEEYTTNSFSKRDREKYNIESSNYRIVREYDGYAIERESLGHQRGISKTKPEFYYYIGGNWEKFIPVDPSDARVNGEGLLNQNIAQYQVSYDISASLTYSPSSIYFETQEEAEMALEVSLEKFRQDYERKQFKKMIVKTY